MKKITTAIVLLCGIFGFTQNMVLDTTFGDNGKTVITSITTAPRKVYFENNNYYLINYVNSITCINYDGTMNSAFGTNGITSFNGANENFLAKGSKYLDGYFYIFGQIVNDSSNVGKDLFIVKVSETGVLDSGFGTNGIVRQNLGGDETINDILMLSNGKIMGIGTKYVTKSEMFISRYNNNGSIDTAFDPSGYKIITINANDTSYGSNLFEFENNILVVGKSTSSFSSHYLVLIKIDSDTNRISSFGTNGVKQYPLSTSDNSSYTVSNATLINGNDLYFDMYFGYSFTTQERYLRKYDISANTLTNISGLPFGYAFYQVDNNQKIFTTGTERCSPNTSSNCSRNFNLVKRNSDGTADTSFNNTGIYTYNFFPSDVVSDDQSSVFYLHNEGKILMAGYGYNPFSTNGTGLEMLRLTDIPLTLDGNLIFRPIINNPINDELTIENFDGKTINEIKIYDLLGNQVFATRENIRKINLSFLQQAVYIAKINSDDFDYSIKLIKK